LDRAAAAAASSSARPVARDEFGRRSVAAVEIDRPDQPLAESPSTDIRKRAPAPAPSASKLMSSVTELFPGPLSHNERFDTRAFGKAR